LIAQGKISSEVTPTEYTIADADIENRAAAWQIDILNYQKQIKGRKC
jgi:hypothetical protein